MKRNYFLIAALLIAATLIATILVYPDLPNRIPMHWNFQGEVDRYGGKSEIFLLPAIMLGIVILFACMPWLSPKKFELDAFRATYLYLMLVLIAFMAYLHALTLWVAFAQPLDMNRAIMGAAFLLLLLCGNVLGRVQQNFFIGVRTPWTLSSPKVWHATHRFAAKVFVIAGLLGLLCVIVTSAKTAAIAIFIAAALIPVLYSLVYYKRLERLNQL